ncbi:hypothetical protein XFHB_13285 [Xylella fastidiosa]|uniref:Uncharacterized protein n=1 Tax=Xylella fastidiosa TaxID=2371 RepID=A0ABD7BXR5_XYLFS|nr:hypothetical protein [Xylella fastidiosa]MDG5823445.1 hypothetical protein [Xylella fastidiosa subsp. pauca]MDG5826719.1 hypothetical protein [Xylella fastidiosa subsp. pauca]QPB72639.1 hypothetical protein XFHB_13285 [Xylella fastidiosa]
MNLIIKRWPAKPEEESTTRGGIPITTIGDTWRFTGNLTHYQSKEDIEH